MKRIISTLFGLAVLCLFAEAHAVPTTVSFTGRLTTTNGPVSGNVNVTFSLFDQATNGTAMWTETRNNLPANNGLIYADLGALTTLDESVLLNAALFLEIQVGAEVLTPRLPLQSVPYSIRSEVANSADTLGTIAPGDVVTTVNASGGISANRTGNTVTLTGTAVAGTAPIAVAAGNVSLTTCGANQIYKVIGGVWSCQNDANTPPTATAPLSVTGVNVALTTCPTAGHVYKMVGGAWSCQPDADTAPTASAPLNVAANNVTLTTCPTAGHVYKMVGGAWSCQPDADTLPAAGTGISVAGATVSIDGAIVARKDAAGGNQAFDTSVLFLDYTNNRVGVGTAAPAAGFSLDVSGAARATSLGVVSAQTGYYNQPGHSFSPDVSGSGAAWNVNVGYGNFTSGQSITLGAQVAIPDGVTINQLTCYRYDNDTTNNITGSFTLYRRAYLDIATDTLGTATTSTTTQSTAPQAASVTVTLNNVVDNDLYQYFIYGSFGTTPNVATNLRFYGCRVRYTWTTVRF